jgi:glutamate-1-semialdehyde 2,1-aminomutase
LGNAPRSVFEFKDRDGKISNDIRSLFLQETCKRGILFGVPIFMTFSHTKDDINKTLEACEQALKICKKAVEDGALDAYMQGEKIGELFRPQPKS